MSLFLETFVVGSGPPLLFLGGANSPFSYYKRFIDIISKSFQVYYFNYPGIGKSEAPKEHTLDVYIDSIEAIVKQYDLKSFHLAGASFGGFLAVEYAHVHIRRVKSLFLFSPLTQLFTTSKLGNAIRISKTQLQNWKMAERPLTQNVFSLRHLKNAKSKLAHSEFVLRQKLIPKHIPKKIPIFVLLGKKDYVVNTSKSIDLFSKRNNVKIMVIKDSGHDTFATMGDNILKLMRTQITNIR